MISKPVIEKTILFSNGNKAVALLPSVDNDISQIVAALNLDNYRAVIISLGGADNMDQKLIPVLNRLFEQGIARAAATTNALIIDGGTKSGVMEMMGKGVAGCGSLSQLIGVAPLQKISLPTENELTRTELDPNHSHFVLVEGDNWGSETETLFNLAKFLAEKVPAIAILVGGGKVAKAEILRAVRLGLYIIVVKGSGGTADEINTAWQNKPALTQDAVMQEIIEYVDLHFYSLESDVGEIERVVVERMGE